ncbi:SDR family oxidoreductase [Saxibacter everestensis]|uniref:SDR family oxidoreductase n=2 Tax=Saxibacter everestensis TaxID=2909229 RepID=A0ABY8R0E7_9MICO|nr:SDR family oxidoreductase [Brevibacteriaceae bacterium ZFBP1038]
MNQAKGKVIVITGAGSGIGRATAQHAIRTGHGVVLLGRREQALRETAEVADQEQAIVCPTDVTEEGQVEAAFGAAVDHFGRVDVLFNNAGTFQHGGSVADLSPAEWRAAVDVNLTGMFLCAREAFRLMRAQSPKGGRIINNGSISAHSPRPGSVAYTTTKHAITGLTKSISLDGRPHGIACSQIDIGNAATELTADFGTGVMQADGQKKAEPMFDVSHVARAVINTAELPLDVNVQFMTLMATNMPFLGRG